MVKKVAGVNIRIAKKSILNEELIKIGIKPRGSVLKKICHIDAYVRESLCGSKSWDIFEKWKEDNSDDSRILSCETCGGMSTIWFDRCPYCGESELDSDLKSNLKLIRHLSGTHSAMTSISIGESKFKLDETGMAQERLSSRVTQTFKIDGKVLTVTRVHE